MSDPAPLAHQLRRYVGDPASMRALRGMLREMDPVLDVWGLTDDDVVRRLAQALELGLGTVGDMELQPMWPVWSYDPPKPPKGNPVKPVDPTTTRAPVDWKLVYPDGKAVKGFVSLFQGPGDDKPQELEPDGGGHHKIGGYFKGDPYSVEFLGKIKVKGKVEDAEGKPVKGVHVEIERAYGPPQVHVTDGGGAFEAKGFVEEEHFSVVLRKGLDKFDGKFVDPDGKAMAGVKALVFLDRGDVIPVTSGADGKFKVAELIAGEGYAIEVIWVPGVIDGKFVDPDGKVLEGIEARVWLGPRTLTVTSGPDGKIKVHNVFPGETASLEVLGHGRHHPHRHIDPPDPLPGPEPRRPDPPGPPPGPPDDPPRVIVDPPGPPPGPPDDPPRVIVDPPGPDPGPPPGPPPEPGPEPGPQPPPPPPGPGPDPGPVPPPPPPPTPGDGPDPGPAPPPPPPPPTPGDGPDPGPPPPPPPPPTPGDGPDPGPPPPPPPPTPGDGPDPGPPPPPPPPTPGDGPDPGDPPPPHPGPDPGPQPPPPPPTPGGGPDPGDPPPPTPGPDPGPYKPPYYPPEPGPDPGSPPEPGPDPGPPKPPPPDKKIVDPPIIIPIPVPDPDPPGPPPGPTPEPKVHRVRLTGWMFDSGKAFLLPTAMVGMRKFCEFYSQYKHMKVLVNGHTDTQGHENRNVGLSMDRASSISSFLREKVDDWYKFYTDTPLGSTQWGLKEDQYMLSALPEGKPPYYAIKVDGKTGKGTRAAFERFQQDNNLPVTGEPDEATRKALIKAYMKLDGTSLPEGTDEPLTHGCGWYHLAVQTGPQVACPGNRRVEVFLFEGKVDPPPKPDCPPGGCEEYAKWLKKMDQKVDVDTGAVEDEG